MSHPWIDPNACQSLAVLVESVTAAMLIEHPAAICLEVDIDQSLGIPADPQRTVDLINTLVKQSLSEMPDGGELTVTACETIHGVELEFADTGGDVADRVNHLPLAAAAIGASITWKNCPQGGAAAMVTFHRDAGSGRMAA